jgi:hypothetical protein
MKYQVKCMTTDDVLFESHDRQECGEWIDYEGLGLGDVYLQQIISCRGCGGDESQEQSDAHGISTGHWCHKCYESDKYPYRKDRYPTIETHGYGERLEDDY